MDVLLDTCAFVWYVLDPDKLSASALSRVKDSAATVCFSAVTCGEIACAVARNRLTLDRHWKLWVRHFVDMNGWQCLSVDQQVMEEAYSLPDPFHNDPVDRILVATARIHRCRIVTGDARILNYPHVESLA